jgi:hypothetical protein
VWLGGIVIAASACVTKSKVLCQSTQLRASVMRLFGLLCVLFTAHATNVVMAAEHGFNAPTQGRNVSHSFKRYAANSQLATPSNARPSPNPSAPMRSGASSAKAATFSKNLSIEPVASKTLCAKPLQITCTLDAATTATPATPALIQLELTPLRESMPVTPYLKPKNVYVRRNTVIVAYTFR